VDLHGKKGVVKAKFRKGVPGQAIGTTVEVVG
jgi:ribosomal protein L35AE/L33A